MKIAVVGGGIFGCVSAIKLKQTNPSTQITIFERNAGILSEASGINQYRLHAGYHYPRSSATAVQSRNAFKSFAGEFNDCIITSNTHYYAIASKGSLTNKEQYLRFLREHGLYHEIDYSSNIRNCDLVLKNCSETLLYISEMYLQLVRTIRETGIELKVNTKFTKEMMDEFDVVVNCTYSNLNELLDESEQIDYQFEICEKPIVRLDERFKNTSIVILDGEFTCLDPYEFSGTHVMGHVKHAIHHTNVGKFPEIPAHLKHYLGVGGRIKNPEITNFPKFVESARYFFDDFNPVHLRSMYTIRTVLPDREMSDDRPTYITKHSERLYSIFSGKIVTCVDIANELVAKIFQ